MVINDRAISVQDCLASGALQLICQGVLARRASEGQTSLARRANQSAATDH